MKFPHWAFQQVDLLSFLSICISADTLLFLQTVKTYEDMTLDELDENEDEFGEEDEAAIEMYRWVKITEFDVGQSAAICHMECIAWIFLFSNQSRAATNTYFWCWPIYGWFFFSTNRLVTRLRRLIVAPKGKLLVEMFVQFSWCDSCVLAGKSVLPSGRPLSQRTCSERLSKSPARITSKRSTKQVKESGWCCTSTSQGMSEILNTLDRRCG